MCFETGVIARTLARAERIPVALIVAHYTSDILLSKDTPHDITRLNVPMLIRLVKVDFRRRISATLGFNFLIIPSNILFHISDSQR